MGSSMRRGSCGSRACAFFDFIRVLRRCAFVVTDSGGSQEECFYLDRPCLVHRLRTERRDGLGENVVLSGMRADVLRDFLADAGRFRRRSALPVLSPSDVIVDDLEQRGFAVGLEAGVGAWSSRDAGAPQRDHDPGSAIGASTPAWPGAPRVTSTARSARGAEITIASCSDAGGGSTLSRSFEVPRGTSTMSRSSCARSR